LLSLEASHKVTYLASETAIRGIVADTILIATIIQYYHYEERRITLARIQVYNI
jgi:hypothetical protein